MKDNSVTDFLSTMSTMSTRTSKEYAKRLNSFRKVVLAYYDEHITIDNLIVNVKEGSENPYSVLNNYAVFLLKRNNVSNLTLKQWIVTVKNFTNNSRIEIVCGKCYGVICWWPINTEQALAPFDEQRTKEKSLVIPTPTK
jgi:hypothetical protein